MPLAPSFDTVGWFARDAETLRRVGEVLLGPDPRPMAFERLLIATDAFALAEPAARAALEPEVALLRARLGGGEDWEAGNPGGGLGEWMQRFRTIQAHEISAVHGGWIAAQNPRFGPDIAERFAWARTVGEAEAQAASAARVKFAERLSASLTPGTLLALPTAPNIAPLCSASADDLGDHRLRVLSLTSIAGLSGLPQVTLPVARVSGCPLGLSLIGPAGSDASLLAFAKDFTSGPGRG
jgi:amidase